MDQMEYWIVYNLETFAEVYRGSGNPGSSIYQELQPGHGLIVVPFDVIRDGATNLDALKVAAAANVDLTADQFCLRFLTAGETQMARYLRKETEARAWVLDQSARVPFLQAEAKERGIAIEVLVPEVIARADEWETIGALVEGRRMGVKDAIARAETFGDVVRLFKVDWAALIVEAFTPAPEEPAVPTA
jgi:hypothetical protein